MTALAVVERPNGKIYRARKAPEYRGYRDDHRDEDWVGVIRTHDVDLARQIARPFVCSGLDLDRPILSWWRETIRDGEPWIEGDSVNGVPCVLFQEIDE